MTEGLENKGGVALSSQLLEKTKLSFDVEKEKLFASFGLQGEKKLISEVRVKNRSADRSAFYYKRCRSKIMTR